MSQTRQMQQEDINAVGNLWKYVYKEKHPTMSDEELDKLHNSMQTKYFQNAVAASMGYVYEIDGKIIGFITLEPNRKDPYYIDNLYVCPRYRRRGVAKKLIKKLQKIYDYLSLHVFEDAAPAIQLYEVKCGFNRVREKVGKNKDKIFMEWFGD